MYPFQENGIDGVQLSQMVEEDLENLGIPKVFDKLIYHLLIDQFRYIKIQPNTMDLSTRLWGISATHKRCIYSPEPRTEVCCFSLNISIDRFHCHAIKKINRKPFSG